MNQPGSTAPKNLTALLADDDAGIQLTLRALLEQKGFVVTPVNNGVAAVEADRQYTAIVSGIIKLAHSLGMTVIAEGVETAARKAMLVQEQCDEIQGHLVSMALSPQEFASWRNDWEVRRLNANAEIEAAESITQWH
jgi:CheY-like chemotaxis protein